MKTKLHFEVVPDKRFIRKNGTYALRLRITSGKTQLYFPVMLEATEETYKGAFSPKPRKDEKELRSQIERIKDEAEKVCAALQIFTPEAFKASFFEKAITTNENDVFSTFRTVIAEFESDGSIGNASVYKTAMRSIAAFVDGRLKDHALSNRSGKKQPEIKPPKLKFEEITVKWLERYEKALSEAQVAPSTQGIYFRVLRRIINIERKKNPSLPYPFGKDEFTPPTATKNKRALTIAEVRAIRNYEAQTEPEQRAKDLWIFSYLSNGMNVADIIKLRYTEIKFHSNGCTIEFTRQKTKHKKDKTKILIELDSEPTELIKSIIERHGNKTKEGYIFPYLNDKDTPQAQYTAKLSLLRLLNKALRKIGANLNLEIDLTTYVARHSYATVMQRSGVSIAEISEALGHTELKTTENYLGGFSQESKRLNSNKLM